MALAGIELRFIVDHLSDQIDGYYVNNIYGITKDSVLFKLRHTDKQDLFLMVSTFGIWLTSVRLGQIEENKLQRRLRSDLLRMRITEIRQIGVERITYLEFEGFGKEFVLVVELFGDGNILLCSKEMKVLALQHAVNVRHRTLGIGSEYAPPPPPSHSSESSTPTKPTAAVDALHLTEQDFDELVTVQMAAAKWLGRTLGLPKKYAEGILRIAGVAPGTTGQQLTPVEASAIFEAAKQIISDVTTGNHTPVIIHDEQKSEAIPIMMMLDEQLPADSIIKTESFMAGLDTVFTDSLLGQAKTARASGSAKKMRDLQTQITEQQKAIETVKERSESTSALAKSLMQLASQGILMITDERAKPALEALGAQLVREKGLLHVRISDKKIGVDAQAPMQSIASSLFDEAKHQARAAPAIERAMVEAQQKLDKLQSRTESEIRLADNLATEIRKKSWFERYRWFLTSDGSLAVGGRDTSSNSALIRKQMAKNDRIFHAEVHGSPFFILKDARQPPSDVSMSEVAHATVCFSRAWREGMHGMSAYWVDPDQIKKSAPTGQFLPKGSFTIEGQRNFIKAQTLRLAVGMVPHNDGHVLICGPLEPIAARSICYAVVEPHGLELSEAAKRIRSEFMRIDESITKGISLDEFVRTLPAGKSQIKDVRRGEINEDQTLKV